MVQQQPQNPISHNDIDHVSNTGAKIRVAVNRPRFTENES